MHDTGREIKQARVDTGGGAIGAVSKNMPLCNLQGLIEQN
jgi:hypothetical protein